MSTIYTHGNRAYEEPDYCPDALIQWEILMGRNELEEILEAEERMYQEEREQEAKEWDDLRYYLEVVRKEKSHAAV